MSEKVCVFVDGENFRHAIVELFPWFHKDDYLPKSADWDGFFDWLVYQASPGATRVRTYWYVLEDIDFFPYKYPKADLETDKLKRVLCKSEALKNELEALAGNPLITRMNEIVDGLREKQRRMRNRFDGWTTIQGAISSKSRAVEFRRAGSILYNLFDDYLGQEKSVDVKLAVDLIVLREIYDVALIVSGDQDYVPAVQVVKDSGKRVVNVAFEMRNGKLLPGGARRLNQATDWSLQIPHDKFATYLRLQTPPPT